MNKRQLAEILVDANISTPVYINGNNVGSTPYTGTFNPEEVVVKVQNYETRISLTAGVKTVIERDFAKDNSQSSGQIVSFEKDLQDDTSVSVVTNPGGAQIIFDGVNRGFSPMKISGLTSGSHQLDIEANGYSGRKVLVNLVSGYRLVAVVDLMQNVVQVSTPVPVVTSNQVQELVEILQTPTGFLRVRQQPNTASNEVAEIHPGDKFVFLARDDKTGWFQIQLDATSSGWISNTYAATTSGSLKN